MKPAQARELIGVFFGPEAAEQFDPDWPETMLGLPPAATQREVIEAALEDRLARISAHPLGAGAPALELASVLRSVAGQMVSLYASTTRPAVVESKANPPVAMLDEPSQREQAWQASAMSEPEHEPTGLEADATQLLARHGRVNVEVIERLSELARERGLSSEAVAQTIQRLSQGTTRSVALTTPELEQTYSTGGLGKILLIAAGACVLVIGAGLVLLLTSSPSKPTGPVPVATSNAKPSTPVATLPTVPVEPLKDTPAPVTVGQVVPTLASSAPDVQELLKDMRRAGEIARDDASQGQVLFLASWRGFKRWWPRYDTSYRQAMQDAAGEYLYRAADDGERVRVALDELLPAEPLVGENAPAIVAENLWPEVLAGATLLRLVRERNLPPAILTRVTATSERVFGTERPGAGASLNAGMITTLRVTPARFVRTLSGPVFATGTQAQRQQAVSEIDAAFTRYEQACIAGAAINLEPVAAERAAQGLILDAIEHVLRFGPDPVENQGAFALISGAIGRQKFRPGDPSRQRLVSWLTDQRISASMLNVVTAALVTKSVPDGVDLAMVLAPNADPTKRSEIAEKLAQAWSLSGAGARAELSSEWSNAARTALNDTIGSDMQALASAATFAKLSAAASLRWAGQGDAAKSLIASVGPPPGATVLTMRVGGNQTSLAAARDAAGVWALKFLAVDRTVPARLARLRELDAADSLSQVDADVLLEVACTSASQELRLAAQKAALKQPNSAPVLAALLKQLPRLPRSTSVGQFVEQITGAKLGPMGRDDWMIAARRAVVEKLLDALAAASPAGATDQFVVTISEAYHTIESAGSEAGVGTSENTPEELRASAERNFRKLRQACEQHIPNARAPIPIDQIETRRAARRTVASGPIQVFAVEQLACVEAMAYLVSAERPAAAAEVAKVMTTLASERQKASSIMDQLRAAEIANVRLWALRFGETLP